ncbi:hypothetical protein H3N56_02090 [Cetobacterium sp. 2A]|nr:hypothetical protein [Cetobacterium sp. 2A]MBC2855282.1 hypothetical protein [Cetobacterium sp. 2A]
MFVNPTSVGTLEPVVKKLKYILPSEFRPALGVYGVVRPDASSPFIMIFSIDQSGEIKFSFDSKIGVGNGCAGTISYVN